MHMKKLPEIPVRATQRIKRQRATLVAHRRAVSRPLGGLILLSLLIMALLPVRSYPKDEGGFGPCPPNIEDVRYVDAQATGFRETEGDGRSDHPFRTVIEGVLAVPTNGVVLIRPGTYAEALLLTRPMKLQSTGGPVRIGAGAATPLLDCAPGVPPYADEDGDGIVDSCEQALAEKYAPVIYHAKDEPNLPTNVDWFLQRTELKFRDDTCDGVSIDTPFGTITIGDGGDLDRFISSTPTQAHLLNWCYAGGCGATDTVCSNGTRTRTNDKHRTFYLRDLDGAYHGGSTESRDWTTYYHAYPNDIGGVTIQYWRFYAYNTGSKFGIPVNLGFGNHGGDWEGIHVELDAQLQPDKVRFLGHTDIEECPTTCTVGWEGGTHPRVFSEWGGHASSPIPNPFDLLSHGPYYIRQETWTGGKVDWAGRDGRSATAAGPLINVGAKIAPMNGQIFIQYSCIWGNPGGTGPETTGGYWGPPFNETEMTNEETGRGVTEDELLFIPSDKLFITAWCEGFVHVTRARECHPFRLSK
jgi:hypothetical protein